MNGCFKEIYWSFSMRINDTSWERKKWRLTIFSRFNDWQMNQRLYDLPFLPAADIQLVRTLRLQWIEEIQAPESHLGTRDETEQDKDHKAINRILKSFSQQHNGYQNIGFKTKYLHVCNSMSEKPLTREQTYQQGCVLLCSENSHHIFEVVEVQDLCKASYD